MNSLPSLMNYSRYQQDLLGTTMNLFSRRGANTMIQLELRGIKLSAFQVHACCYQRTGGTINNPLPRFPPTYLFTHLWLHAVSELILCAGYYGYVLGTELERYKKHIRVTITGYPKG